MIDKIIIVCLSVGLFVAFCLYSPTTAIFGLKDRELELTKRIERLEDAIIGAGYE